MITCESPSLCDLSTPDLYTEEMRQRLSFYDRGGPPRFNVAVQGTDAIAVAAELCGIPRDDLGRWKLIGTRSSPVILEPDVSTAIAILNDGREVEIPTLDWIPPEPPLRIELGTAQLEGLVCVIAPDDLIPLAWTLLVTADCSVLTCRGAIARHQLLFLKTAIDWEVPLRVVLVQADGDAARGDANGLAVQQLGVTVDVFVGQDGSTSGLKEFVASLCAAHGDARARRRQVELAAELELSLEMQEIERSALEGACTAALQAAESVAVAESALTRSQVLFDKRMSAVEAELRHDLQRHFESGGPIVHVLESELAKASFVHLTGWGREAKFLEQATAVLTGLFAGRFIARLRRQTEAIGGELFDLFRLPHSPMWNVSAGVTPRSTPELVAPTVWTTYLMSVIKLFIAERATPIPHLGIARIDGVINAGKNVVGVATGAHQLQENVEQDFHGQLTLKVLGSLASQLQPPLHDLLTQARSFLQFEVAAALESRVRELQALQGRVETIDGLDDLAEPRELRLLGLQVIDDRCRGLTAHLNRLRTSLTNPTKGSRTLPRGRNLLAAARRLTTRDPRFRSLVEMSAKTLAHWCAQRFSVSHAESVRLLTQLFESGGCSSAALEGLVHCELVLTCEQNRVDAVVCAIAHVDGRLIRVRLPLPVGPAWTETPAVVRSEFIRSSAGQITRLLYAVGSAD